MTYTNNEQTEQCVKGAPHVISGKSSSRSVCNSVSGGRGLAEFVT